MLSVNLLAVNYKQLTANYPLQLCTQTAEAMAVSTVMIRLMIFLMVSFLMV